MKKSLLNLGALAALTLGTSTAVCAQTSQQANSTRFLVMTQTFGDMMGDTSDDVDSKRELNYYNTNGQLIGSANYGRTYVEKGGTGDFEMVNMTTTKFDANGNMTNQDTYQWGQYDYDDYAWKKTYNCESYTYNDAGQLIADTTSQYIHVYEYNDAGLLAKKSTYYKRTQKLSQEFTYSYVNGVLVHYASTGVYDSYKFEADLEYDADGNKTEEYQYSTKDNKTVSNQIERWTYTDGVLTQYEKSRYDDDGQEVPETKTVYTPVGGDLYTLDVNDYYYNNGTWTLNGLRQRYTYRDFGGMAAQTAMSITSATLDDKLPNTVNLKFTLPAIARTKGCKFIIYRNCAPVDTVGAGEVYYPTQDYCLYQDKNLKNGTYNYFVQPLVAPASAGDNPTEYTETYYATSPVDVNVTLSEELPAVTGLALVGGEVKTTGTIVNLQKDYIAKLAWKNPENMDKFGFVKNSVFFTGAGVSEADVTDATVENASVSVYDKETQVYVMTTYEYGKAFSDTITVKMTDIDAFTGVNSVSVDGVVKATFAHNNVTLSDNANVAVYTTAGAKVYDEANTASVALGNMPKGTYIICVEKDSKTSVYKYTVK